MLKNPFEGEVRKVVRKVLDIEFPGLYDVVDAHGRKLFTHLPEFKADYLCLAINHIGPCVEALQWAVDTLNPEGERSERGVYNKARGLLDRIDAEMKGS